MTAGKIKLKDAPDIEVPTGLYIGGQFRAASGGGTFPVLNPATEQPLCEVADGTVEDAKSAIEAASKAFPAWGAKSPRDRGEILRKCFELFTAKKEFFARLMTLENGKALVDSRAEAAYAAEFFRWYAEEAPRNIGEVSRAPSTGARILVQHKPAGIAVLVTPWNFPAAMGTRKIAPALAAGCTVVLKPASETPLTMLALAELFAEAGVPPGVVNILPSRKSGAVVAAMLKDPRVRVISFTGSTETGRKLLHEAADMVVRPAMELGGNAPFIVCEDADIDAAVDGAMIAKMRNMGEACTAANRFYVHEKVHDAFVDKFAAKMKALKVGNGLEEGVAVGPLVNADTRDKVVHLVEDALNKGAKAVIGGSRLNRTGYFYPPTVLVDVPDSAQCLKEEIFGPVAPIQKFSDEDEAIRKANDTEFGLISYVYTKDMAKGLRISERLEAGMIGLNRGVASDPAAPFGGAKQSGIGREGAHEGMMEFLETQYISVSW
ncbi:MAG TPA: NAD-dependent succinate-semialdehyde dehydrogenase [Stellaceae bacterium]|nr:NAD-dependent succinate-semialdehyde dehydrogenase [Stellaceae bacterium]